MQVIVVGAGVIGASIAWRLAQSGAGVTVIEAGRPAGAASGGSFGWVNASFYHDAAHHRLRVEGIAAHHRMAAELGMGPDWTGCLWWEAQGAELAAMAEALTAFDYPVERIDRAEIRRREPAIAHPPEEALAFAAEGAVDPAALTAALLRGAVAAGAQVWTGVPVEALIHDGTGVTGVRTVVGELHADWVIVAAGTRTEALLAPLGIAVPLVPRPGLMLRTRPMPPLLHHIVVTTTGEVRQEPGGCILLPTVVSHQGDSAETVADRPDRLADAALKRLRHHLPQLDDDWAEVNLGWRPVPRDGLPVIGPVADGAYVAVLHSGVTLAAIVGELVAKEVTGGQGEPLLAPYRAARFA